MRSRLRMNGFWEAEGRAVINAIGFGNDAIVVLGLKGRSFLGRSGLGRMRQAVIRAIILGEKKGDHCL